MKILHSVFIGLISIGLSACSCFSCHQSNPTTYKSSNPPPKNPITVSLYTKGTKPHQSYKVIGLETVSKYNHVGIKRQEANIRDTMRKLAAAMGGDAIINLKYSNKKVQGTVISFDKRAQETMG